MTSDLLSALDDGALAGVVEVLPADRLAPLLYEIVPLRRGPSMRVRAAIQSRLDRLAPADLKALLADDSPWLGSMLGRWLLADAWSVGPGKRAAALALWDELVEQSGEFAAEALISRARARREAGEVSGAAVDLMEVARRSRDYALLSKATRLWARLIGQGLTVPGRKVRIGLISSSTTDLVPPLLRLLCARDGLSVDIYCAPYGVYRQELLNPESGLYVFAPEVVIIALNWRDVQLVPLGNPAGQVESFVAELTSLWAKLHGRLSCTILQHTFDTPAFDSGGYLSATRPDGRLCLLRQINVRLIQAQVSGVLLVDCERLAAEAGRSRWHDETMWHVAKQHPAAPALPGLVEAYARLIAARIGLGRKVLVFDLDNTLWHGVVGEDGPHGIAIGAPSAVGEAHAALQRYAAELKQRGVLLAVCSKNNDADAREPFRGTEGMVLKEADFAVFLANWDEKPANLRRIAKILNLGTDSLVFLDDNPLERAKVRREMPEVAVVDLPSDPAGYVAALDQGRYFEAVAFSGEDAARHAAYAANTQRESLKTEVGDIESFLRRLDMRMFHGEFTDAVQERVVQLLNKTNQFNVTTRRHGAAEVAALRGNPAVWTQYFRLVDCFGDNGIIGLLIAVPDKDNAWEIDTLLMSCRVLGRQAEEFMLMTLLAEAERREISVVRGRYIPTTKNGMVADLFLRLGFAHEQSGETGEATFVWHLAHRKVSEVRFVRDAGS